MSYDITQRYPSPIKTTFTGCPSTLGAIATNPTGNSSGDYYLMSLATGLIKEKRDGTIKGRTCADGSKQQGKFSEAETGSPTIANDALFLSIMIDAYENHDTATADIAGAYLHALMKDFIAMHFVGWAVDLLCEVKPTNSLE